MRTQSMILAVVALSFSLLASSVSRAEGNGNGQWKKNHPRRAEVNGRLANQNKRINQGVKDGQLTPQQAQQLKSNDKSIRQQERTDAAADGGHITKGEQKQLNQEENANSTLIHDEKHPAGSPPSGN